MWILRLATLVLAIGLQMPGSSRAQIPGFGGATEITQILNYHQLYEQIQKWKKQLEYMQDVIEEGKIHTILQKQIWERAEKDGYPMDLLVWGEMTLRDIHKIEEVLRSGKNLAYVLRDLDEEFSKRYKEYDEYSEERLGTEDFSEKYQQWSEETHDTIVSSLKAAGLQADQYGDEEGLLSTFRAQAATSLGQHQTMQIGLELQDQQIRQLQKLRQLLSVQIEMQANFAATKADREAMRDGEMRQWNREAEVQDDDGKDFSTIRRPS